MAQLGAEPTVQHFNEIVINLPENEKAGFVKGTFGLAFSEWGNLNVAYREFLVALIKSKRQQFVEFVRKDTSCVKNSPGSTFTGTLNVSYPR